MSTPKAYSYIRFSSEKQKQGDSLRRQTEATKAYCEKHGLVLDESLKMQDLGLSAFHGHHKSKGALGIFLKAVEAGKIPVGSTLIVENLDRLSREEILTALNQFTGIIQAGITLVTLQDGMRYSQESITHNWSQLIISITYMARAHEESITKSRRLSASWSNRRNKAISENRKMTSVCPLWLRLSDDKSKFIVVPEAKKAITEVFKKKLAGKSPNAIVEEMNTGDGWKPPASNRNPSGGWTVHYVRKLIHYDNGALVGTLQAHKRIDGKRVPDGKPMKNYYPKVIDENLYKQVKLLLADRHGRGQGRGGGKVGKASNVFAHLLRCGKCGSTLHFIAGGGNRPQYLYCDSARRKLTVPIPQPSGLDANTIVAYKLSKKPLPERTFVDGVCDARPVNYKEFFDLVFEDMQEIDVTQLIPDSDQVQTEISTISTRIDVLRYELQEVEKKLDKAGENVALAEDPNTLKRIEKFIRSSEAEKERLLAELQKLQTALHRKQIESTDLKARMDNAIEIGELLRKAKSEQEQIDIRLRLRGILRQLVERVEVYPLSRKHKPVEVEEMPDGDTLVRWTKARSVRKIRIRYIGSHKTRVLIMQHTEII